MLVTDLTAATVIVVVAAKAATVCVMRRSTVSCVLPDCIQASSLLIVAQTYVNV